MWMIWIYYDHNLMASTWGITKEGFVYYMLWNIAKIPFDMINDLLFFDMERVYHGPDFLEYLKFCDYRYTNRATLWKIMDNDARPIVEDVKRSVDHFCFCS